MIVNIKYVRKRRELASLLAEYEYALLRITECVLDAATSLLSLSSNGVWLEEKVSMELQFNMKRLSCILKIIQFRKLQKKYHCKSFYIVLRIQ